MTEIQTPPPQPRKKSPIGIIVVAVIVGLFLWHVSWLEKCREYNSQGIIGAFYFVKNECPVVGPYAPNSNVVIYALFHRW